MGACFFHSQLRSRLFRCRERAVWFSNANAAQMQTKSGNPLVASPLLQVTDKTNGFPSIVRSGGSSSSNRNRMTLPKQYLAPSTPVKDQRPYMTVKDQGRFGACRAVGVVSTLESNELATSGTKYIWSEAQVAYSAFHPRAAAPSVSDYNAPAAGTYDGYNGQCLYGDCGTRRLAGSHCGRHDSIRRAAGFHRFHDRCAGCDERLQQGQCGGVGFPPERYVDASGIGSCHKHGKLV